MFRKYFLRKLLTRVGRALNNLYGASPFYTTAQIKRVIDELKLKRDHEYCLALFTDPTQGAAAEIHETKTLRTSIYRYFAPDVLDTDIETNKYSRILKVDESSPHGAHTPIEMNKNISPFTGS